MTDLAYLYTETYAPRDTLSHEGARDLAFRIREHWSKRGYDVRTSIEHEVYDGHRGVYAIRSDMTGGWPREHPALIYSASGQRATAD